MNKQGQTIFMSVIVGIFLFLFGILFVSILDTETKELENPTTSSGSPSLNCGSADNPTLTITDGAKLACLGTETIVPYFIVLIVSVAGGFITERFIK